MAQVDTVIADKHDMLVSYLMSTVSVILFCGCCYALIKSVTVQIPLFNKVYYSKAALRIARAYKVLAWSMMTLFFLMTLVTSFAQIFTEI